MDKHRQFWSDRIHEFTNHRLYEIIKGYINGHDVEINLGTGWQPLKTPGFNSKSPYRLVGVKVRPKTKRFMD